MKQGCDNWDIQGQGYQEKEQAVLWNPGRHTVLQQGYIDGQTSQINVHWVDGLCR